MNYKPVKAVDITKLRTNSHGHIELPLLTAFNRIIEKQSVPGSIMGGTLRDSATSLNKKGPHRVIAALETGDARSFVIPVGELLFHGRFTEMPLTPPPTLEKLKMAAATSEDSPVLGRFTSTNILRLGIYQNPPSPSKIPMAALQFSMFYLLTATPQDSLPDNAHRLVAVSPQKGMNVADVFDVAAKDLGPGFGFKIGPVPDVSIKVNEDIIQYPEMSEVLYLFASDRLPNGKQDNRGIVFVSDDSVGNRYAGHQFDMPATSDNLFVYIPEKPVKL